MPEIKIVDSYNFKDVFFIFRENGDEVECKIINNVVYSPKYRISKEESEAIKKRYNVKQVNKLKDIVL